MTNKFIISDVDIDRVSKYNWRVDKATGYFYTYINSKKIYLHRFITNNETEYPTDHINHNKADNRRENLRIVTNEMNARNQRIKCNNQSGYRNIYPSGDKYVLQTGINGKVYTLGRYDTITEALEDKKNIWKDKFNLDLTDEINEAINELEVKQ